MKKEYIKPSIKAIVMSSKETLLAGSGEPETNTRDLEYVDAWENG